MPHFPEATGLTDGLASGSEPARGGRGLSVWPRAVSQGRPGPEACPAPFWTTRSRVGLRVTLQPVQAQRDMRPGHTCCMSSVKVLWPGSDMLRSGLWLALVPIKRHMLKP